MRSVLLSCATVACLLVTIGADAGRLYKWVDETGKVHYSDSPPPPEVNAPVGSVAGTTTCETADCEYHALADHVRALEGQRDKATREISAIRNSPIYADGTPKDASLTRGERSKLDGAEYEKIKALHDRISRLDQQIKSAETRRDAAEIRALRESVETAEKQANAIEVPKQ
jgi:hypothetical protein